MVLHGTVTVARPSSVFWTPMSSSTTPASSFGNFESMSSNLVTAIVDSYFRAAFSLVSSMEMNLMWMYDCKLSFHSFLSLCLEIHF